MNAEPNKAEQRIAELEKELARTREELVRVTLSRTFQEVMLWFLLAAVIVWALDKTGGYWVIVVVMTQVVVAIVWNVRLFLSALKKSRSSRLG